MYILNQLAQYEVPQTKANPNPERPLLRLDHQALMSRAGPEIAKDSRFQCVTCRTRAKLIIQSPRRPVRRLLSSPTLGSSPFENDVIDGKPHLRHNLEPLFLSTRADF